MKENKKSKFSINRGSIAKALLLVYDAFVVNFSYFLALWFRFDCEINTLIESSPEYLEAWLKFAPINTVLCLIIFSAF